VAINKDTLKFIEAIGINADREIDESNIGELTEHVNRMLLAGSRQAPRDVQKEVNGMVGKNVEMYDTVEDFKAATPSFVIGKAAETRDMSSHYNQFNVVSETEYVMTSSLYKNIVEQIGLFNPSEKMFVDNYRRYSGEDLTGKTLLVWREGGIGDLLFIRPILAHLKSLYDCKIVFATRKQYWEMLKLWDCIDKLVQVPFPATEMYEADYHLTFMGVIEKIKEAETTDVHDLFSRYAGLDPDNIEWTVPMPTASRNKWFLTAPKNYAVVQGSSSSPVRTPRIKSTVTAINAITEKGLFAVIADSQHKARQADDIISMVDSPDMVINFARFTETIQDAVKLISSAQLVVAPDSSMVHIAAMQGVPCVGIYGPFSADSRTQRYPLCETIEPEASDCCSEGGKHCFLHSHKGCEYFEQCWQNLDNERLKQMITNQLEK